MIYKSKKQRLRRCRRARPSVTPPLAAEPSRELHQYPPPLLNCYYDMLNLHITFICRMHHACMFSFFIFLIYTTQIYVQYIYYFNSLQDKTYAITIHVIMLW